MDCDVKITNPSLRYTTIVTYKGAKRKMPVKGTISGSDVTYKSKNAATVDVTDTGVISAKNQVM